MSNVMELNDKTIISYEKMSNIAVAVHELNNKIIIVSEQPGIRFCVVGDNKIEAEEKVSKMISWYNGRI